MCGTHQDHYAHGGSREPSTGGREGRSCEEEIFRKAKELEDLGLTESPVAGRWSLVYSTQTAADVKQEERGRRRTKEGPVRGSKLNGCFGVDLDCYWGR